MEINIDTKAIQDAIVRSVADSAIGETIKKYIGTALTERRGYGTDSILEEATKAEVARAISLIVREEIDARREEIRALVVPYITEEVVTKMMGAAMQVMFEQIS